MYAVIQTGGKQYRVKEGMVFFVEKLSGQDNQVVLDKVLMIHDPEKGIQIGAPLLEKARVSCEILDQFRDKKVFVYKCKRRKKYRRRQGHRQYYTRLRVLEIAADGKFVGKTSAKTSNKKSDASSKAPIGFESAALGTQS